MQEGVLPIFPDVTIEGGYYYALESPKWKEFKTEKGQQIVEVSGEIKKKELNDYVLEKFFLDGDMHCAGLFTDTEKLFWEKYNWLKEEFSSNSIFDKVKQSADLNGVVRKYLYSINRDYYDYEKQAKSSYDNSLNKYNTLCERQIEELINFLSYLNTKYPNGRDLSKLMDFYEAQGYDDEQSWLEKSS